MTSKELRQKRAKLVADMNSLLGGDFTSEVREKWEKLDKSQDSLRVQIEAQEKSENLEKEMHSFTPPPQRQPGADLFTRGAGGSEGEYEKRMRKIDRNFEKRSSEEYRDQWENYARFGNPFAIARGAPRRCAIDGNDQRRRLFDPGRLSKRVGN